jgi:hypothetical protein
MSEIENPQQFIARDGYQGPDRRSGRIPPAMEAQIALMVEEEVERRMSKLEERLMLHMDSKFAQLHRLISDAFPNGDPHGHRAYHELQIKQADGWDKIKGEVVSKFLTGGLWIAAGWLAFAVWQAFKEGVRS